MPRRVPVAPASAPVPLLTVNNWPNAPSEVLYAPPSDSTSLPLRVPTRALAMTVCACEQHDPGVGRFGGFGDGEERRVVRASQVATEVALGAHADRRRALGAADLDQVEVALHRPARRGGSGVGTGQGQGAGSEEGQSGAIVLRIMSLFSAEWERAEARDAAASTRWPSDDRSSGLPNPARSVVLHMHESHVQQMHCCAMGVDIRARM